MANKERLANTIAYWCKEDLSLDQLIDERTIQRIINQTDERKWRVQAWYNIIALSVLIDRELIDREHWRIVTHADLNEDLNEDFYNTEANYLG